jgi:hypothetical protein
VDFDQAQFIIKPIEQGKSSHWRSAISKARVLPKIRPSQHDAAESIVMDPILEQSAMELDLSSSQRGIQRPGLGQARSILRKQMSSNSSVTSTDISYLINEQCPSTSGSMIANQIPLGTRSQRLFGGSECFAQIMNELQQQVHD